MELVFELVNKIELLEGPMEMPDGWKKYECEDCCSLEGILDLTDDSEDMIWCEKCGRRYEAITTGYDTDEDEFQEEWTETRLGVRIKEWVNDEYEYHKEKGYDTDEEEFGVDMEGNDNWNNWCGEGFNSEQMCQIENSWECKECGPSIQAVTNRDCVGCGQGMGVEELVMTLLGIDVEGMFPSLMSENTGKVVRLMVRKSGMEKRGFDWMHAVRYI